MMLLENDCAQRCWNSLTVPCKIEYTYANFVFFQRANNALCRVRTPANVVRA